MIQILKGALSWLDTDLFHPLGAESADRVPYMHGSKYGVQDSRAELLNVPWTHLILRQEQEVPNIAEVKSNNVRIEHDCCCLVIII